MGDDHIPRAALLEGVALVEGDRIALDLITAPDSTDEWAVARVAERLVENHCESVMLRADHAPDLVVVAVPQGKGATALSVIAQTLRVR